jgi:hypothetical protein
MGHFLGELSPKAVHWDMSNPREDLGVTPLISLSRMNGLLPKPIPRTQLININDSFKIKQV